MLFITFQNYHKNLDPSCKTDLEFLDYFGRQNLDPSCKTDLEFLDYFGRQNLDPSCKTDLEFLDCFGGGENPVLKLNKQNEFLDYFGRCVCVWKGGLSYDTINRILFQQVINTKPLSYQC